jgi:hypothetical protein
MAAIPVFGPAKLLDDVLGQQSECTTVALNLKFVVTSSKLLIGLWFMLARWKAS